MNYTVPEEQEPESMIGTMTGTEFMASQVFVVLMMLVGLWIVTHEPQLHGPTPIAIHVCIVLMMLVGLWVPFAIQVCIVIMLLWLVAHDRSLAIRMLNYMSVLIITHQTMCSTSTFHSWMTTRLSVGVLDDANIMMREPSNGLATL